MARIERTTGGSRRGTENVRRLLAHDMECKAQEVERLVAEAERSTDPGKAKLTRLCAEHAVAELDQMGRMADHYQRLR
ncbi:MAG: hypothetical protein ACOY3P_24505 [Planctomycetota bacterium]